MIVPPEKKSVQRKRNEKQRAAKAAKDASSPSREEVFSGQPDEHIRQLLLDGEKVLRVARIHPAIYWKSIVMALLGILLLFKAFNLGVFFMIVAGLMAVVAWMTKHFLMLALTNKRVLLRYGIIKLEVIQIHHRKIESVELGWTILGQFLGYASVMITGTGSRVSIVPFIADAPQFRKDLEQILLRIADGQSADEAASHD